MTKTRFVAFLRGVNVGGKLVSMEKLRQTFEDLGFGNVKTLLNSGNVVFDALDFDKAALSSKIEQLLEEMFGFKIIVILKTTSEIQDLVKSEPFKEIEVTEQTRLYVTFLKYRPNPKTNSQSTRKDFQILKVEDGMVLSVVRLSLNFGTTEAMKILETEFGKDITTRNWNTILKITTLWMNRHTEII